MRGACAIKCAVQGRCPSEPASTLQGAASIPKRATATQCVLRAPIGLLASARSETRASQPARVWLDNLLFTTATAPLPMNHPNRTLPDDERNSSSNATAASQLTIGQGGEAWLTNVVLDHSDSHTPAQGLALCEAARLYARSAPPVMLKPPPLSSPQASCPVYVSCNCTATPAPCTSISALPA